MSTCKGCGASILWATAAVTGKVMPLNLPPDPEGNLMVGSDGKVRAVGGDGGGRRYSSHFATCPRAGDFRKRATGGS